RELRRAACVGQDLLDHGRVVSDEHADGTLHGIFSDRFCPRAFLALPKCSLTPCKGCALKGCNSRGNLGSADVEDSEQTQFKFEVTILMGEHDWLSASGWRCSDRKTEE